MEVESNGNPLAVSPVGAAGLLQIMPATGRELGLLHPFDPLENLDAGVRYLRQQYDRFPEIKHSPSNRIRWAWASYNGGRGFANKVLSLARQDGIAEWWQWEHVKHLFADARCSVVVAHRRIWCDHGQITDYVARIEAAGGRLGVHLEA